LREIILLLMEKIEDLVTPIFAADLAPNVRAGVDSTCDFILHSHAALDSANCIASYPD
jgi:hypothetical protein